MFFTKSVLISALLLAISVQVQGHALVAPPLGVLGKPTRGDVQRPGKNDPCGKTNISKTLNSSKTVTASADGSVTLTVTSFNGLVKLTYQYLLLLTWAS